MSDLSDLVRGIIALEPASPAFEFRMDWRSWGAIGAGMATLDTQLAALGVGTGARIGVLLKNHVDLVPAVLEVLCSDRCLVTLNGASPPARLVEEIDKLGLPVLVGLAGDLAHADVIAALHRNGTVGLALADGASGFSQVGPSTVASDPARRTAPGVGIEMLTSGTTGTPKRVPLKTRNFERMVMETAVYERGRQGETGPKLRSGVQLLTVPLSHIGGVLALFTVVSAGRKACILEKFAVESYVDAIARHRPKVASAPPSALRMILDRDVPKESLSSLIVFRTGTAPLDPDLADAFEARYGIPVLQNYGATEFAGGVAGWTIEDHKAYGKAKRGSV
ncbi:MAG: AMP-binding protein, partial [Caulobacterales bacterium]